MNATVLNKAIIGSGSVIGANALVPQGMVIPPHSLVLGVPAKVVKTLDEEQINSIEKNADEYVLRAKTYREYYNSQRK
jgi:carbonic anhydrase/acetyltransferase-like protein (isoleucine patch superfamily)